VSSTDQTLVAIFMRRTSDWETMRPAAEVLAEFGIPCESRVVSAHRTPQPGRKMGHLTALAADGETAADRVREARRLLSGDERCVGQAAATDGCPQPRQRPRCIVIEAQYNHRRREWCRFSKFRHNFTINCFHRMTSQRAPWHLPGGSLKSKPMRRSAAKRSSASVFLCARGMQGRPNASQKEE
jgi:hypothetical protein